MDVVDAPFGAVSPLELTEVVAGLWFAWAEGNGDVAEDAS